MTAVRVACYAVVPARQKATALRTGDSPAPRFRRGRDIESTCHEGSGRDDVDQLRSHRAGLKLVDQQKPHARAVVFVFDRPRLQR